MSPPLDWDAAAYEQVSTPQQAWGAEVLSRLELRGDETALDAGCGAGQVTEKLVERLPRGRVTGVDASPRMIEKARARLGERAELIVADLLELALPAPVEVILSTATFHWVPDHPRLWRNLRAALAPGGRLEVQFGGHGNVATAHAVMAELAEDARFAAHLSPFRSPWIFPTAEQAAADAGAAGLTEVRTWLARRDARPPDVPAFIATSIVGGELDKLPDALRGGYLDAVVSALGHPDHIPYVRVNVSARG